MGDPVLRGQVVKALVALVAVFLLARYHDCKQESAARPAPPATTAPPAR